MSFITIYINHPDLKTAKKISQYLLDIKLIACANIFPSTSMYFWNEKLVNEKEYISLLKTKSQNWTKIIDEVTRLHPYEIPCIIKHDLVANKAYKNWLVKNLK